MKKRIISLLICLAVAATTLLGMAWADLLPTGLFVRYAAVTGRQETVSYVIGADQVQVRSNQCTILEASDTGIQLDAGWYAVKAGNFTVNGDIKTTGDVHIVLCDYANLVVNGSFLTQGGGSVSIYAQTFDQVGQTGSMFVDSARDSAFARQSGDPGQAKLCIYGGKIQAKGSQRAMDKNYLVQVGDGTEEACQTTPLRCTLVADETILPADQWMGSSDFDANNIYFRRCDHTQGMYLYTPVDGTHHTEVCASCKFWPGGYGSIADCAFHEHECILGENGYSTGRHTNHCYCGNIGDPAESDCVFYGEYTWLDAKYHGYRCEDCLEIGSLQAHTFVGGRCTVCDEECPHQVDENGKCTICGEEYEAVVIQDGDEGEYEYYYFADFTTTLGCGETVKLLKDVTVETQALPEQYGMVLDLNGKTLTVTPDEDGQAYLLLENNANLELTGSGTIQGELRLQDGGSLDTKETFTGSINAVTVDDRAFVYILSGHIGTLTLNYTQQSDSYISLLSLCGGTFDKIVSNYKDAQGDLLYDLPLSRLLQPGYALRYVADGKLAPVAEHGIGTGIFGVEAVRCTHDGSTADQCPYCGLTHVAEARGEKYYTLQDALDAVYSNGSKVTILDDIDIGAIPVLLSKTSSNRITLDLNGHTVSDLSVGSTDFDHETREIFATGTGLAWITDSAHSGVLKNVSVYSGSLILDGAAIKDLHCYDQATIRSGSVTKLTAGKLNDSAPGARVVVEKVGAADNMIQNASWRVRDAESSLLLKWGFFDSLFIDNFGSVEIQKGIFNCIESCKDGNPYPLRSIISSKSAFETDPDGTGTYGKLYSLTDEAKLENVILVNDHEHEFSNSTVACPCGFTCQHQVDDAGLCSLCGAKFEVYTQLADGTATYYDTIQTAFRAGLQDGQLVQLLADTALTRTAYVTTPGTTPVTLDLHGKTLDTTVYGGLFFQSGKLTIQDSLGGGSIFGDLRLSGTVTVTGGQFSRVELKDAATSKFTLSGGTFEYLNCSGTVGTELLADGCAYYDNSANSWISQLHAGSKVEFINVTVKTCPHEGLDETTGLCGICGKTMLVKVTPAKGDPYYSESLHNDEMAAGEVKLLHSTSNMISLSTNGTLDLNGHDLSAAIIEADGKFVLKNTAETAGSVSNFNIGAIYGSLTRPGTLVIENENIHIGTLTVVNNDGTQLTCGSFECFIINTDNNPGLIVAGILAPNHTLQGIDGAFFNTNAVMIASADPVRVVEHIHSFPDSNTDCACGYQCDHDIDEATGLCGSCGTQFNTKILRGENFIYYPGTLANVFDKAQSGDTIYLLVDGLAANASLGAGNTVTLNFNGKTLEADSDGIILGGRWNAATWSTDDIGPGHLILTGSGGIQDPPYTSDQGILLYYGSTLSTDNFTGRIGKVGLDDLEKLSGRLDGGTYGLLYCNGYTNNIVGSFLKAGYAFRYADETAAYLPYNTALEGWPGVTHIWNVRVVKCPHGEIKNGACTYCNASIAASVRGDSGEVYFGDFLTAFAEARAIGRTVKLYADYIYDAPFALDGGTVTIDLNGYKIAPADGVTAKLTLNGTDLTIQDSSETASGSIGLLQVTKGNLILQSGWLNGLTVSAYNTEANISLRQGGLCGETSVSGPLIPLLQKGSYIVDDRGAVSISDPGVIEPNVNYTIAPAPVSDLQIGYKGQVPLGRQNVPLELSFAPVGEAAAVYTVTWYWMGVDYLDLTSTTLTNQDGRLVYDTSYTDTVHLQPGLQGFSDLDLGDLIRVCAKVTAWDAEKNALWQTWFAHDEGSLLEITNPDLSLADITLDQALTFQPYNFGQSSQGIELTQPITVTYFGKPLTEGTDYVVEGNTGVGAGDYTLTIRPAESSDFLGENSAPWTIAKHTLGAVETPGHKEYDGTTDPVLADSTFWSQVDPFSRINLVQGEDYEVVSITSGYESANVGSSSSSHSATIRLKNSNYIFANGTDTQTLTFTQTIIVGPLPAGVVLTPGSLTVSNNHEKAYTFDLKTLLPTLPENMTFGSLIYELVDYQFYRPYEGQEDFTSLKALDLDSRYYTDGAAVSADGILTLPINAVETDEEGSIGTVNVRVTSGNIKYFPLTVQLTAKNKQIPEGEPTFSATTIDYGQTLSDIEISGTMKVGDTVVPGTFTWNEPNLVLGAGGWNAPWTFTPDNTDDYEIVPGSAYIVVNQVPVTVTVPKANTLTYTGEAQYLLTAGKAKGGWMVYSTELSGTYTYTIPTGTTAGSYTIWYKVDPDSNHTGTQPEPITVTIAQAKAPAPTQGSLTAVNERAETLTLDLAKLLPTLTGNADFGTVTYGEPTVKLTRGYYTDGATVDAKGLLALPVNAVNSTKESDIGTVTVTVNTTNYEDITLTVAVAARNKGTPAGEPNFSTTTIDFGRKIGDIAITGTMQVGETAIPGTFAWDKPDYAPNAGKCTVAWTFTPDDTDEYKVVHGTVTITVNKVPVTVTDPKANTLTYTGQAQTLLTAGSAVGGQMVYSLEKGGTYAATVPTKTDAGTYTVWYKVTADDNHIGTDPASVQVTIAQATAPATAQGSLTVVNERAETLTFDLSKLLPTLAENCGFGAVTYSQPTVDLKDGYYTNGATVNEKGLLTLPVNAVSSTVEGAVGTVTVTVTTTNYEDIALTVNVSARNKGTPAGDPTLSVQTITYGQKVSDIKLSGTMKVGETEVPGTFTWDNGDYAPNAGTYTAAWTFTPDDTGEYKVVHGTVTIAVEKAEVTVTAPKANTLTYTGQPQTLLTAGTAQGGQMVYSTDLSGTYTYTIPTGTNAASYTVYYKVLGDANHKDTQPESLTVTIGTKVLTASDVTVSTPGNVPYNGQSHRWTPEITFGGAALVLDRDYTVSYDKDDFTNVTGDITVTVTGAGNFSGTVQRTYAVTARPMDDVTVVLEDLTYTGAVQMPHIRSVTVDGYTLVEGTDYTATLKDAVFAGNYPLTLTGLGNFTGTTQRTLTIARAEAPAVAPIRVDVTNGYATAYTVDLRSAMNAALPKGCRFGAVHYGGLNFTDDKGYCDVVASNISAQGILTLAVNAVSTTQEGLAATVRVTVETGNYQPMDITLELYAVNKVVPTGAPILSSTTLPYGKTLSHIALSGSMKDGTTLVPGTFAWTEPDLRPASGPYTAAWTFTPDDGKYATVSGTSDITVAAPPATIPVYTVGGTVSEGSLTGGDETPVSGALVTMRKGLEILGGQKTADENGNFSLDGVPAGTYNVVVEYAGKIVTTKVVLTDSSIGDLHIVIPREDVSSELEISAVSLGRDTVVGGLDTEAESRYLSGGSAELDGASVALRMTIRELSQSNADPVQKLLRAAAKDKTLSFMDLSLLLVQNGSEENLTTTNTVLELLFSYDTTRRDITVLRMNDGKAEALRRLDKLPAQAEDGTYYVDARTGAIHIFAASFGTYAVGYTPEPADPGAATGDAGLAVYTLLAVTACAGAAGMATRRRKRG